jgi:hypothetical protein
MNIQEFVEITNITESIPWSNGRVHTYQKMRPLIYCKDGVTLSVQGSETHYCSPRMSFRDYYYEMEVGYPSIRPPDNWEKYYDGVWQKNWFNRVWYSRKSIWYAIKKVIDSLFSKEKSLDAWYLKHLLDTKDNATTSVYGWVPIELIQEFIEAHGGIDEEKTFKGGDEN